MTIPPIPDFPAGYGPQQPDFQDWWVTASTFFLNRITARVTQQSSVTSIPDSGNPVTIEFDTVISDPYSGWDASTHSWVAPAGASGWYMVTLRVGIAASGDANIALALQLSTTYNTFPDLVYQVLPGSASPATVALPVYLAGGQDGVAGLASIHNSSSAIDTVTTTGQFPALEIVWLSS
jgi:hypothetical protein